jgi:hypothetical protein
MEAVAHSPSFAKKAGVPQSVGKDFAAADKGKTFKHGGEMKESKTMVGKEVAFMKKKGAPAAMMKHEMEEAKGMKKGGAAKYMSFTDTGKPAGMKPVKKMAAGGKVRRMAMGGQGDSSYMTDEDYEKQKIQGAENLKRLKGLFGFGNKEEKEAPVPRPSISPSLLKFNKEEPVASTSRVSSPRISSGNSATEDEVERSDAAMMSALRDKTAKGPQYTSSINMGEGEYSGPSFKQEPRVVKQEPSVARPRRPIGMEKTQTKERVITAPVKPTAKDVAKFSSDSPDLEARMEAMKPKRKFGMASDETRAAIRKGLGSALDFFDLSKAHEREFGKKMAKGGNVDGIAKKGKTEGKVVKMAAGGFVKTADGCAQRGKTKAFQVKMKRGGMC